MLSYSFSHIISVLTGSCMVIMPLFLLTASFCQISFLISVYIKGAYTGLVKFEQGNCNDC